MRKARTYPDLFRTSVSVCAIYSETTVLGKQKIVMDLGRVDIEDRMQQLFPLAYAWFNNV